MIRYDSDSLGEPEKVLLALLDSKQYVPPVARIAILLRRPRSEVRKSLRRLCELGYLNVREVPVFIDRPECVR